MYFYKLVQDEERVYLCSIENFSRHIFSKMVEEARDEYGDNLYNILDYLKDVYNLNEIDIECEYIIWG